MCRKLSLMTKLEAELTRSGQLLWPVLPTHPGGEGAVEGNKQTNLFDSLQVGGTTAAALLKQLNIATIIVTSSVMMSEIIFSQK